MLTRLKAAAQSHGRSIEDEALDLVRRGMSAPFTPQERIERTKYYLSQSGGPYDPLTKEQICEDVAPPARFTPAEARARVKRNMGRFSGPQPSVSLDDIREGLEGAT